MQRNLTAKRIERGRTYIQNYRERIFTTMQRIVDLQKFRGGKISICGCGAWEDQIHDLKKTLKEYREELAYLERKYI